MDYSKKEAQNIVSNCGKEFLADIKSMHNIDEKWLTNKILKIRKNSYTKEIDKKDIDFVFMVDFEGDYMQHYFMIMNKKCSSPLYFERLSRTRK